MPEEVVKFEEEIKKLCFSLSLEGGDESSRLSKINKITSLIFKRENILAGGNGDVEIEADHLVFNHTPASA